MSTEAPGSVAETTASVDEVPTDLTLIAAAVGLGTLLLCCICGQFWRKQKESHYEEFPRTKTALMKTYEHQKRSPQRREWRLEGDEEGRVTMYETRRRTDRFYRYIQIEYPDMPEPRAISKLNTLHESRPDVWIDEDDFSLHTDSIGGYFNNDVLPCTYKQTLCAARSFRSCDWLGEIINNGKIVELSEHPSICTVHGFFATGGQNYLIMEYMQDGSALELLQNRTFSEDAKLTMCAQIAMSAQHLHKENIIHADIGLRNFLVDLSTERPRLVLSSFGLACSAPCTTPLDILAPRWASSELMQTRLPTFASDLWAVGVTCWEIFMDGTKPYPSLDTLGVITRLNQGSLRPELHPAWSLSPILEDIFDNKIEIHSVAKTLQPFQFRPDSHWGGDEFCE